jgi:predicted ATPase
MDLTSVGVGVSQVLPIIVMALLAPEHSILIFEQPEVHLHPKIQSILGDFFLGIATVCNKQCLVETHSEHLINRMRRRIAESEHTHLLNQLQIYFVEREQAISRFTPVEPNEYGAILKWPQGFFDESEEESAKIMDAGLKKRQQVKERSRRRHNEAEG